MNETVNDEPSAGTESRSAFATIVMIGNVVLFVCFVFFGWRYLVKVRQTNAKLHKAMAIEAEREAEQAAEGHHALPEVIQSFKRFAEFDPEVTAIIESLDALAAAAAAQVEKDGSERRRATRRASGRRTKS